jgi:DNA-binding MarR family transcriptional regulator
MHILQEKLLDVIGQQGLHGKTLRQIGELIDEKYPQKIKHHLDQLEKRGLIKVNKKEKTFLPQKI